MVSNPAQIVKFLYRWSIERTFRFTSSKRAFTLVDGRGLLRMLVAAPLLSALGESDIMLCANGHVVNIARHG